MLKYVSVLAPSAATAAASEVGGEYGMSWRDQNENTAPGAVLSRQTLRHSSSHSFVCAFPILLNGH